MARGRPVGIGSGSAQHRKGRGPVGSESGAGIGQSITASSAPRPAGGDVRFARRSGKSFPASAAPPRAGWPVTGNVSGRFDRGQFANCVSRTGGGDRRTESWIACVRRSISPTQQAASCHIRGVRHPSRLRPVQNCGRCGGPKQARSSFAVAMEPFLARCGSPASKSTLLLARSPPVPGYPTLLAEGSFRR